LNREYHKWFSPRLQHDMELLVFGHAGVPAIVFPTSGGRFFEFEDRRMVDAISWKIERGEIQLYCVDSVDGESWYNRRARPRTKIVRQLQFQSYIMDEVIPLIRQKNGDSHLIALGCSFGGYHAVNIAMRHPEVFTGFLSMSGAFEMGNFLRGYYDNDVYFNTPPHYLANMNDPWFLEKYRRHTYLLCTGWDDQCLRQNQQLSTVMGQRGIPHQLWIWETYNSHDWPTWAKQMQQYL
jgi:esterase/lipase superfamily enzyme